MAKRFYFCSILGTGSDADPYRCWFQDNSVQMGMLDMRAYPQIEDGFFAVWGEITDADHALAIADPSVTYLPFEDAWGNYLPLTATVGDVAPANRTLVQTIFTEHGVPTTGINLAMTLSQALQLLRRRMMLGLLLGQIDFDDPTSLISAMPPLRIKAIRRALTNYGFDVSGIVASMTHGEAIALLAQQALIDAYIDRTPGLAL